MALSEAHPPPRIDEQTAYAYRRGPGKSKMETLRRVRRHLEVQGERAESAAGATIGTRSGGPQGERADSVPSAAEAPGGPPQGDEPAG